MAVCCHVAGINITSISKRYGFSLKGNTGEWLQMNGLSIQIDCGRAVTCMKLLTYSAGHLAKFIYAVSTTPS